MFALYFTTLYYAWKPTGTVVIELKHNEIFINAQAPRGIERKPVLMVSYQYYKPSNAGMLYFPKSNMGGYSLIKCYYNPPTDPIELSKLKQTAKNWVLSPEGRKQIKEILLRYSKKLTQFSVKIL